MILTKTITLSYQVFAPDDDYIVEATPGFIQSSKDNNIFNLVGHKMCSLNEIKALRVNHPGCVVVLPLSIIKGYSLGDSVMMKADSVRSVEVKAVTSGYSSGLNATTIISMGYNRGEIDSGYYCKIYVDYARKPEREILHDTDTVVGKNGLIQSIEELDEWINNSIKVPKTIQDQIDSWK